MVFVSVTLPFHLLDRVSHLVGIALPAFMMLPELLSRRRPHKQHRLRTLLAAAAALYGGYVLRETVVYAGRESADDPRAYLRHPE